MKNKYGMRLAFVLGVAALIGAIVLAVTPNVLADDPLGAQIAQVRAATVHFHNVATAQAAGYAQFLDCVSEPGQGAMGIHFVNGNLAGDTVLDPLRPEAVIYEPNENGQLHFVAMEYIVFAAAWDAEHSQPPVLFGQTFHLVGSPNRYGVPPFYELHLWGWKHNPRGLFYDWNPKVTCP
ncbi:MAG: hypothetical protein HY868_11645 [Chloroflexi bacterium]|nr:hypothetical protein [Chloroflexota bacterium]